MAKKISLFLGIVFLLVGVFGFVTPELMGTHLSLTHNLIHLLSGAVAVYFGTAGSYEGARKFCLAFGVLYGILGIAGFVLGSPDVITANAAAGDQDPRVLKVIPGSLEFGTADHTLHTLLGIIFVIGGLVRERRAEVQPKVT